MNLDDFKSNWQNQKAPKSSGENNGHALMEKLKAFDKNLKRQNQRLSIAFAVTIPVMLAIMYYFSMFGWIFYFTISATILLLLLSLWLFWKRSLLSKDHDLSQQSIHFINGRIAQLEYNKSITRIYMPIYALVLGTLLMFYIREVGQLMDGTMLTIAYVVTISYIVIIMIYGVRKQRKKDRENIDPMLEELQQMKKDWEAEH